MSEYLAFVDEIGKSNDGKYIYRFDFTENTDVVWGDDFNIAPSLIVPNLEPDKTCLSSSAKAMFPRELITAKKNSCFSMQDCIDGIIAMVFSEIDDNTFHVEDDVPFFLNFGTEKDIIANMLQKRDITFFDEELYNTEGEEIIDNLLNSDILERSNNFDDDDNNEDDFDM